MFRGSEQHNNWSYSQSVKIPSWSTMYLLSRQTEQRLTSLIRSAKHRLTIASPYVGREGTELIAANITPALRDSGRILFLTDLSPLNICQGATDPEALLLLSRLTERLLICHLPRLHAKVYIGDADTAIVTSANLTIGGLRRNREYGIELHGSRTVRRIRRDITEYAQLGARVTDEALVAYSRAAAALRAEFQRTNRTIAASARRRFEAAFTDAQETLIRLRLADGPIHTVFARTIEYLLRRHGPLSTLQLHPLIAALHPDLCDDAVDRVIDGKRFGKKWKHAVRTAQQQLKKRGLITFDGTHWQRR
jgi:hypothetical protein